MFGIVRKAKKAVSTGKRKAQSAASIWIRLRHHYAWHYKYSKVERNTILFESFHGKTVSDSPLHMLREFLKDPASEHFTIYYATSKNKLATLINASKKL